MSIGVYVRLLDQHGVLKRRLRVSGTWDWENLGNLNFIHRELFEFVDHPMTDVGDLDGSFYAVPEEADDYMFDMKTRGLLPNRFKSS